jgi:hypothetical protein
LFLQSHCAKGCNHSATRLQSLTCLVLATVFFAIVEHQWLQPHCNLLAINHIFTWLQPHQANINLVAI